MPKSEEVNYKKDFCEKYFDKGTWDLDVLRQVDVLLKDKKGNPLLYIESKYQVLNETAHRQALAQVILTNKKQDEVLNHVALIYMDADKNDILEFIDCSDNSVMYNNDFNWNAERPSNPTKDAIDRINDRIKDKITVYVNDEIKEFYDLLKKGHDTAINITENNFNVVYNQWKHEVLFREEIKDEQDFINLFLVDILNGTRYKKSISSDLEKGSLLAADKEAEQDLIREGTNLSNYQIMYSNGIIDGIKYSGLVSSNYYTIADGERYAFFWRKYKRPPEKNEFLNILERSASLYSDKYRKDTGGEYTPTCFVELQNQRLIQHYNMNDFIVCDPCAGVGNLENQFGKDFKQYCYLSTLEQMDVDICKIKGFENSIQYDYLKNDEQPKWKYKGVLLDINEIARRENRKLMIVMNPPYQNVKGKKNNLAIEFFNKVLTLKPQVIVFYYATGSFFRDECHHYVDSGYKIVSHAMSNARTTFQLSEWPISQVIFDKDKGQPFTGETVDIDRYEINKKDKLEFINHYVYNNARPNLFVELKNRIKEEAKGMVLGNVSYLNDVIKIGQGGSGKGTHVTTNNLKWCLLSKGLIFNTHHHYFELNSVVYRGNIDEIPQELFNDAIMLSLFYIGCLFSNKGYKNYIMPFSAQELGCDKNDLNVLFPEDNGGDLFSSAATEPPFDFRDFFHQFEFSEEAQNLYKAALEVFRFYHRNHEYTNKDWNDSFYDITNALMGKDASSFQELESENDTRISKTKTTKGTRGFGKNTINYVVSQADLPIFDNFFQARDILAQKINKELVDHHLLLWKRENIY